MQNKKIKVCYKCGYNHVEERVFVDVNTNEITDHSNEYWCDVCNDDASIIDGEDKGEIIGFQVVDDDNNIHPDMKGSFCVYNHVDALYMVVDDEEKWKVICIYKDDIEEPTFMFEGDPMK